MRLFHDSYKATFCIILTCLALFCFSTDAYAANRYWVGGAGNWSDDVNHWATTSGGTPGVGNKPGPSDTAIFDANSGTGTVTLDENVTIGELSLGASGITIDTSANNYSFTVTSASGGTGDFTINAGTFNANTSTISVGGNWDSSGGTFNRDNSTVKMNGANNTITGPPNDWLRFWNLTIDPGASITLNSKVIVLRQLTISGTLTIPAGIELLCVTYGNNLTINSGGELTGAGTFRKMVDNGANHIINNGTISVSTFRYDLRYTDAIPITATTYGGDLVIQIYSDTGPRTGILGRAPGDTTSDLIVNGTLRIKYTGADSSSITLDNTSNNINIIAGALEIGDPNDTSKYSILKAGSATVTINGNVIIYSSDAGGNNEIDAGSSTWVVSGNWINNDTFIPGTSTVIFDGGNQSVSGSTTFYNLAKTVTTTATLTFDNTATQTIINTLTLSGSSGQLLLLRSDVDGKQWEIDPQGTRNITFVDVKDSNNINTLWISAMNSINSDNNTGWYFIRILSRDIDNDGTIEEARDGDGNSSNGYEVYFDPNCPIPGTGKICSTTILSTDGDGDNKIDHFIDIDADGIPEKYWDPDKGIVKEIALINTNGNGSPEWVYDADNNGTYDHAYNDDENTFMDPFGVVFDSITNKPIAGAIVTIYNSATGRPCVPDDGIPPGFPLTNECIASGDINPVITPESGVYGFNTVEGGSYYITVEAEGYTYPFRPATRIFNPEWGRNICVDNPPEYPSPLCQGVVGSRGEIFVQGNTPIAMDHPLDPTTNLLKITKEANKREVSIGDIITYIVTIESRTSTDLEEVYITDRIPPGFKYIKSKAILDGQRITDPEGNRPIVFNIGTVRANQTRILKYQLIVGSGVSFGEYENSAWANYPDGTVISNTARERVKIVPDPLFDLGTVIGKVFWDRNENGKQDKGEIGIPNVQIITEEGTIITTDKNGKYHLAGITPGRHIFRVNENTLPDGAYLTTDKAVIIDITPGILQKVNFGVNKAERSHSRKKTQTNFIFVVLGDVKAGYTDIRGNIEPVGDDKRFQRGFWSRGRLAYYLKGKIKGKYLITSSLDTDRDKRELFRNLDPDKYYPVYGDASTVSYEATDTQGVLYLAIEWDKSKALWGNYHTDITDTELAQFNRTLYGAKIHYETVSTTPSGEPITKLIIFQAKPKYRAAHNEFLGTGGSLYYLKHRPVVEGSEKVAIEVRDKNTDLVIARLEQKEGKDYEIDYTSGRIMFYEPVSQIAQSSTIISSALLDGNHLYIVVDYEYEVTDITSDEWSYGGRVEQSLKPIISKLRLSDSKFLRDIRIGGTYVRDAEDSDTYELRGIDTTLYLGEHTKIIGEYAETQEQGVKKFFSTSGGLSFTELPETDTESGRAYSLKSETMLFDRIDLKSYYKKIEKGFSSSSTASQQGKEMMGGEMTLEISDKSTLRIKHDTQRLIDEGTDITASQVGADRTETTTVQISHEMDNLKLTGELRHIEVSGKKEEYASETNESGNTIALRADYDVKKDMRVFLEQQVALKEDNREYQITAGISTKVFDWLNIRVSETIGEEESATLISARAQVDSKTEIYNAYSLSSSHVDGRKEAVVTGMRKKITDSVDLTTEVQNSRSDTEVSKTNIFGLSGKINERWGLSGRYERGMIRGYTGDISTRNAGSIGISYVEADRIKASTKIELRIDKGEQKMRQYLSYNTVQWQIDENTILFGKISLSESINTTLDRTEAEYKEFVIGSAYRPVKFDRLNLLAKYTYLEDETGEGQTDMSDIEEQRAHVLAAEAVYDLTDKWQLVEKIAFKQAREKVAGFDFTKTQTWLWINRVNYNLYRKWQVGAEYRILKQRQARDMKQGVLVEVARDISKNIQIGVGYNFTDFNDNLTYLDYTSYGPFIRLSAKITD